MSDTLPKPAPSWAASIEARNLYKAGQGQGTCWALTLAFQASEQNWSSPTGTPNLFLPNTSLKIVTGWFLLLP